MESSLQNKKLEPGVFQGSPDTLEKKVANPPRVIRTMKLDASEAIRNQEETTVSIAIAEEKKRARQQAEALATKQASPEVPPPAPKPIGRFIVVIIILIVIALLGAAYVFLLPKLGAINFPKISMPSFGKSTGVASTTIPLVAPLASSLIKADEENRFNISSRSNSQVFSEISLEKVRPLAIGFIKNMYFEENSASTTTAISANRLLMFANISAPEILTRSLENEFMVGLIGDPANTATPFTILKVSSNDTGIAGMLEWESNLPNYFDTVFHTNIAEGISNATKFKDIVVLNKDVRMITTALDDTLLYAFANPTTIVITNNQSALETLLPLVPTPTSR